jgi:predicted AlkP superfamily phosphohydrolase/phosphomutase
VKESSINRRRFLKKTVQAGLALSILPYFEKAPAVLKLSRKKVYILGIDGMDPNLLRKFVARGGMPVFKKFISHHYSGQLRTTMPPQSPVAWASFITGSNPGVHGIYDFIHRDPSTFTPYLSTTRSEESHKKIKIGKWSIPLDSGAVTLLRKGTAFWDVLESANIPVQLFKMPANFPVPTGETKAISGMSTPDLLGSYGTFTYFTEADIPDADRFTGGRVVKLHFSDNATRTFLEGPPNSLRTDHAAVQLEISIRRDPRHPVARIRLQNHDLLMKQGEWSEWLPVSFELMPVFSSVKGMVRLYLQRVHDDFRLYVSPINVDPADPSLPVANPLDYAKQIADDLGRFYTQGFPEDTKALSNGIFSSEEFLNQSQIVLEERLKAFDYTLSQFNEGVYFFYFSSIDQNSHVLLSSMNPGHPLYEPDAGPRVKNAIYDFYCSMDGVLEKVLNRMDDQSTFILLSDHGFAPFTREFHLSTWLVENGFTAVTDPVNYHDSQFYDYVDWKKTRAYVMGLNSIYINRLGREVTGSVYPADIERIKTALINQLESVKDPVTGQRIILKAYDTAKLYQGPEMAHAPDIVLGYQSGYRISDESVLGKFPTQSFGNRTDRWSSDHCMDPSTVPGVLLTNLEVASKKPAIWDLAPTVLAQFGLKKPGDMDGLPITG